MINSHAILLSIVGDLRKTALAAGWMDQFGPDGALYDNGLAVWEMLPGQPGGYNNAIHELAGPHGQLQLQLLFTPNALANFLTIQEIVYIDSALNNAPYATLDLAELAAVQSTYYAGNSLAFQNLVVCPQRVGVPSTKSQYVPYDYASFATVLDTVAVTAKSGNRTVSTYLNVGLANNLGFFTNAMGYEIRYGQLHFARTGVTAAINGAVLPSDKLVLVEIPVQLFWGAPITNKWVRAPSRQRRRDCTPSPPFTLLAQVSKGNPSGSSSFAILTASSTMTSSSPPRSLHSPLTLPLSTRGDGRLKTRSATSSSISVAKTPRPGRVMDRAALLLSRCGSTPSSGRGTSSRTERRRPGRLGRGTQARLSRRSPTLWPLCAAFYGVARFPPGPLRSGTCGKQ